MADDRRTDSEATEIEIFGAVYHVRGRQDSGYLQGLARRVDRTMRDIADQVSTVDTAKIAILAALNLADELTRCQQLGAGEKGAEPSEDGRQSSSTERFGDAEQLKERLVALTVELSEALGS